jgi:tetratricopeptide (TPR) repeat protein
VHHLPKSSKYLHRALAWQVCLLVAFGLFFSPVASAVLQDAPLPAQGPGSSEIQAGIASLKHNDAATARLRFSEALRADPTSVDALVWRGVAENQLKQFSNAEQDFTAALIIDPNRLPAHYNLALTLIRLGKTDRAVEELRTVVQAQPGRLEPEYNLAILLEQQHRLDEAIDHLNAAHRTRPDDISVIQHLLIDLDATGQKDEALALLNLLLTSTSADTRKSVGTTLLQAGEYTAASILFESVLRDAPADRKAKHLLAWAYIGAREHSKAIDLLKPLATADSGGESAYLLGVAYEANGDIENAKSAYDTAIRTNPRNGRAAYHLGMIEASTPEKLPAAVNYFSKAVSLEPENPAYGIALGKCLLEQNSAVEAQRVLQRVRTEGAEAGERDLLLGIAEIAIRGPASAIPTLERSVREDPSLALSENILGFCYLNAGETAKAAVAYGKASDLMPESRIFAHSAAIGFDRANDPDRAYVYAQRAVALPDAIADDHFQLGRLLAKAGKPQEAIQELNQAIASNPDSEEAYFILARCYSQVGNSAQADLSVSRLKELQKKTAGGQAAARTGAAPLTSSTLFHGAPDTSAAPIH